MALLAIGTDEAAVVETTKAEIRAAAGDRFSYCPFKLSDSINYRKVIDLRLQIIARMNSWMNLWILPHMNYPAEQGAL